MKKLVLTLTILSMLNNVALGFIEAPRQEFGPQGDLQGYQDQAYGKPSEMADILPNRPVAAHDKYGNRIYFTPGGNMILKITKEGNQEYSIGFESKEYDKTGNLVKETTQVDNNRTVTKNAKGEVMGYTEYGLGGKAVKEYDENNNLTKSYTYDKYGKNAEWVMDELTQTKTVFSNRGDPIKDIDFEGNVTSIYKYDNEGNLASKQDVYGNVTHFDKDRNMTHTTDVHGNTIVKYAYETDENGYVSLGTVEDVKNQSVTYFKDGKQDYTINNNGMKTKEYHYDSGRLVYVFEHGVDETTFYNVNGKELYTMHNDILVKEWLYFDGRLVGFYSAIDDTTTIYQFQREDVKISSIERPTAATIKSWYDTGLIADMRIPLK